MGKLENILSQISHTQKEIDCLIRLTCGTQNRQIHRDSEWKVVIRGWGNKELMLNEAEFQFGIIKSSRDGWC